MHACIYYKVSLFSVEITDHMGTVLNGDLLEMDAILLRVAIDSWIPCAFSMVCNKVFLRWRNKCGRKYGKLELLIRLSTSYGELYLVPLQ